jgi:hypothetical protein
MATSIGFYDIGDLVRLRATFLGTDLVTVADPSTILFRILAPGTTVACYSFGTGSIARSGVGAYYKEISLDLYGDWTYNVTATGGVQTAAEWDFTVRHSKLI